MQAWTDYPFVSLGDVSGELAPVRKVRVVSWDGDKYCKIVVEGKEEEVKAGYLYSARGRIGEVPCVSIDSLSQLDDEDETQDFSKWLGDQDTELNIGEE
jgi:hypothetical protein